MMGVGTPMATQVKRTVWPGKAWMDSSGGVITWGGAGGGPRGEEGTPMAPPNQGSRHGFPQPLMKGKDLPPSTHSQDPHSLQPNSSERSGQSTSSSQW